ncbi:MAG: hypothetical protein GY726_18000 [Proteobacteria bacterium]|nr:hypothetical protein [Pseudomonadota bacterium]
MAKPTMRKLSYFVVLIALGFSTIVFAQKTSAQYDIAANTYQSGDFAEAEKLWIDLAIQGDPNAQYALAIMHLKKEAQRPEDSTAFRYLVEAAKKQHVASMFNLGVAYWEGRGVARQPEKALNWWEVAAQRDDAGAQYNLGLAYYIGEGRPQSTPKALYWAQQASNNGHSQAQALFLAIQSKAKPAAQSTKAIVTTETSPNPVAPDTTNQAEIAKTAPVSQTDSRIHLSNKMTVLRAAPDLNSAQVLTLKAGTSVRAISTRNEWTQIMVPRSYPVWVYETFLQDLGDGKGKIKGNRVNIRPSASTNNQTSPPLGQLNNGQRVAIVSKRSPWIQIVPPQPFPAWVITRDIQ